MGGRKKTVFREPQAPGHGGRLALPDQEYLLKRLEYDQTTGILYWKTSAYNNLPKVGTVARRPATGGYWTVKILGTMYRSARIIMKMMTDTEPNEVDHRDKDPSNDAWVNLRPAERGPNEHNTTRKPGRSGRRGVQVNKDGKYFAKIKVNGRQIYLGTFEDLELAEQAYIAATHKYYGEFSYCG